MGQFTSIEAIRRKGFSWPNDATVESHSIVQAEGVDLQATLEKLISSRDFYQGQINEAFRFKSQTGADYSDFTDRFDDADQIFWDSYLIEAFLEDPGEPNPSDENSDGPVINDPLRPLLPDERLSTVDFSGFRIELGLRLYFF